MTATDDTDRDLRKRVVVMISGRGSNMAALIAATMEAGYPCKIVAVLSDRPEAAGLELARRRGIETAAYSRSDYADRDAHEDAILSHLDILEPDIICLAGFMRLLSAGFVERWAGRIINIHPSLLPSFPGLDTHQRVLSHQVLVHGCSVHFVTEDMDAGPLIGQTAVPVLPDDDEESLAARVLKAEHRLYPLALRMVAEEKVIMTASGALFADVDWPDDSACLQSPHG